MKVHKTPRAGPSAPRDCEPDAALKTFSDNAIGNMLTKSDVGAYVYPAAGQPLPHVGD